MYFTIAFCVFILCVAVYFAGQSYKFLNVSKRIKTLGDSDDLTEALGQTEFKPIVDEYKRSIIIQTPDGVKTNTPASYYFSDENIAKVKSLNLKLLDSASGTLVGLGLFGTFLGLTIGVSNFDSSNSEGIQNSIQSLLSGMSMAFGTSLFGMFSSLAYTFIDKIWRKEQSRARYYLTEKLDEKYYIDDTMLLGLNQKKWADAVINTIQTELDAKFTYTNDAGEKVHVGNAVREILKENIEQSKALKSFSTDLAIELNNGFDEILSRQMQEKILPLMESVDATTKLMIEHIDEMASTVASPATEMMESIVDELKRSMMTIVEEFKTGLSGSATSQMEALAVQLGTAAQAMGDFPKNMENISATLQVTIEEVKNTINEISKTSANANSAAMQQMQEQIAFATDSIGNAIAEVKDVMSVVTKSSQEQSNQMVAKLADAADKMGEFLNTTITSLSSGVENSVKSITDEMNRKQTDLINLQGDTTAQTKKLLEAFNEGLERLEQMNGYITDTMNGFKKAQGEISVSTGNLRTVSGDMKLATELLNKSQNGMAERISSLQKATNDSLNQMVSLIEKSGRTSDEYVEKFEIIKSGLGEIFTQLQNGLAGYSRTVQESTKKYLDQYSASLTQTTDALSSTIQQQNEVVEMLNETLSRRK